MWLYMVVNRGVGFKSKSAWLFTTLHTSLGAQQYRAGFPSLHSRTKGRGGLASCGKVRRGHICLSTQMQPSWIHAAHATQVFFQASGHSTVQNQRGLWKKGMVRSNKTSLSSYKSKTNTNLEQRAWIRRIRQMIGANALLLKREPGSLLLGS